MTTTTWNWMNDQRTNSSFQSFCLNKSTRQHLKRHAKQSTDLCATFTGPVRMNKLKVKKFDDIDARNIITSLYDSLIAFYKENYW